VRVTIEGDDMSEFVAGLETEVRFFLTSAWNHSNLTRDCNHLPDI
jgi:hypothetical protein